MPYVVVLAGPNGAGKSTSAPLVVDQLMAVGSFVNADVIARGLSAFNSESVAFQALAAQSADFAFETTLASRTFAPFLRELRAAGYHVQLVYVWLNSADLCIERVRNRAMTGGHFVEEEIVRRRYERSLKNFFSLYQSLADDWRVYDNSDDAGSRLVAVGSRSIVHVVHEAQSWTEMKRRGRL